MQHRVDETEPDPLYDAPFLVFVYSAWAAASLWIGERIGLVVLVTATITLGGFALRRPSPVTERPFIVDFGTILLFTCAAIAGSVLVLDALPT